MAGRTQSDEPGCHDSRRKKFCVLKDPKVLELPLIDFSQRYVLAPNRTLVRELF